MEVRTRDNTPVPAVKLTQRVLRCAFLGPGKRSWVQVALIIGGDNTPNTVCQIAHRGLNSVTFDHEKHDTIEP